MAGNLNPRAINLSVTTRGIGLSTCSINQSVSNRIRRYDTIPDIYSQYRAYLGIFESRLAFVNKNYPLLPRCVEEYDQLLNIKKNIRVVQNLPSPIRQIIEAVGIIHEENKVYVPALAAPLRDSKGKIIPRPENVVLSTLRETVEALANQKTLLVYRQQFENRNPIPGAIWKKHLLLNPDEIISKSYDYDYNLQEDIALTTSDVYKLTYNSRKHYQVQLTDIGRKSIFVSNEIGNIQVPPRSHNQDLADYYKNCRPIGDIDKYSSPVRITQAEVIEGAMILLGERPETNMMRPVYAMRDENVHAYDVICDYQTAYYRASLQNTQFC